MIVQHDPMTDEMTVESYTPVHIDNSSANSLDTNLVDLFLSTCDSDSISCKLLSAGATDVAVIESVSTYVTRKYKPVAKKVQSVVTQSPEQFHVVRDIKGDPLEHMPVLNPIPLLFVPNGRYTEERKAIIDAADPEGFLWPAERELMQYFMAEQNEGFAWSDAERSHFRTDFFPPIEFPVVPHTPWIQRNIPIPPGIYQEVCMLFRKKIEAGIYEPSNSSYCSRWFVVTRKDGKSLCIVHSLEPLNAVTI